MNLIALGESLHTFKDGKPGESWAHENSNFALADVMNVKTQKTQKTTPQHPHKREKSVMETHNRLTTSKTEQLTQI